MAASGSKQLKALAASAAALLETVWSLAEKLVPVAENAAESAGKWVARNSPEIVRERLIPGFIEAFQDAA